MATFDNNLNAFDSFLTFGRTSFAEDLAPHECKWAVRKALYDVTKPFFTTSEENTLLVKMWDRVAFTPPRKTKSSVSSIVWKEGKDLKHFMYWLRLCQTHREQVAGKRGAASSAEQARAATAAEQGRPGSLPSWLNGVELSERENTECYKLTMKHIL